MYFCTLKADAYCLKYKKIIPVGLMADCFWCTDVHLNNGVKNERER